MLVNHKIFCLLSFLLIFVIDGIRAQILDRLPAEWEVNYSPANNEITDTNPPAFIWLPAEGVESYNIQYSTSSSFDPLNTVTVREIGMTVHIPYEIMETGTWYWRYGYTENGKDLYSSTRRFEISTDAVHFPLVPVDEVIERIPRHRPRLYFSPELVDQIRNDTRNLYTELTQPVIDEAEEILTMNESLFREPDPWPEDYSEIYVRTWRLMRPYTQRMVTSALAWLYTGDERFAEEAKRRLMHFMSWDVEGPSSTLRPTELGMNIAENATPVFDWIYEVLTEDERQICIDVLAARMVQINLDVHRARQMESNPFQSHAGRMVGFAIEGGIVLAHETPEAREWLDYTLKLAWSTYPAWGGAPGGWHDGVQYWSGYMDRIVRVVHELDIYGIPLKNKPFFRNTGWFGLYVAYPQRPRTAFGDEHHLPLDSRAGLVTYMLSNLYDNPYYRWHSERVSGPAGRQAARIFNPGLESRSPSELPQSRVFEDVGIVAMHSNMDDPENNVMMLFKSNPFGSIGHNHASQNAFVLEAFKEPLAISSGYREPPGIPHHFEWVRKTRAYNSILVDNEGQVPRKRSSRGRITKYIENNDHVYTVGDATAAYDGRLNRFHRHVLYARPGYFIIIDDLETSGDLSTYQWLFHTMNEMEVDDDNQLVISRSGDARLALRFLSPIDLEFLQHTGFDPPVEHPETASDQYHLKVSTLNPSQSQIFVTVIWVDKDKGQRSTQLQTPEGATQRNDREGTRENSPIRIIENKGIGDRQLVEKCIQSAGFVRSSGGVAVRVEDDLFLWKYPDARRVRSASAETREPFMLIRDHFR
jgi:hypothetical protein